MRAMRMGFVVVLGAMLSSCGGSDPSGTSTSTSAPPSEPECGDLVCDGAVESCRECPTDCDACPSCGSAPSCTGALAIPTGSEPLASFDNGGNNLYESGLSEGF